MTRMKCSRTILLLLLIIAMIFPASARAASPAGEFAGAAAVELSRNIPALSPDSAADGDFITYSELDALGRPGAVTACLSRASLSQGLRADSAPLPVGWVTMHYFNEAGERRFLYSLCPVLSPALGGDTSDTRNVFTGTRTLRDEGMQPYADKVADYLSRTANHVLYRVTPAYNGDDLVPFGVQMEALSVEDGGRSVRFNVFLYNVEPGFSIDYRSGESIQDGTVAVNQTGQELLASHYFPAPAAITAPGYGSFEALYEAFIKSSGITTSQLSTKMQLWRSKSGEKYHLVNPCGNMDPEGAHQETVDLTKISSSQLCETCCQSIIQALPSLKANAAAASQPQSSSQPASAASTQSQSTSAATQSTSTASQSTGSRPISTPAPTDKPDLLSLGSSLLTSALSSDTAMVWISSSGNQYHSTDSCSNLDALYAYQKTLDWASAHGYERCPYCW